MRNQCSSRKSWIAGLLTLSLLGLACRAGDEHEPLKLIQTIHLKGPAGRLDHLELDAEHGRLFVANMANASLDVIDLKAGKLHEQIPGQKGIQGIAYAADLDRIFVGNGEGNTCNVFDGHGYKLLKSIPLEDADNVRYHPGTHRIFVGHADKGLAVIDAKTLDILAEVELPGSPEAFQLESGRPRLYLNIPSPSQVVVVDTEQNKVAARYSLTRAIANYPLALDEAQHRLFIGCRKSPKVVILDTESGKEVGEMAIPGDTDDLFWDAKRQCLYVSCGAGSIVVIRHEEKERYTFIGKLPTVKVARTSMFDPNTGQLYLVVPRQEGKEGPEVRVYQAP